MYAVCVNAQQVRRKLSMGVPMHFVHSKMECPLATYTLACFAFICTAHLLQYMLLLLPTPGPNAMLYGGCVPSLVMSGPFK